MIILMRYCISVLPSERDTELRLAVGVVCGDEEYRTLFCVLLHLLPLLPLLLLLILFLLFVLLHLHVLDVLRKPRH